MYNHALRGSFSDGIVGEEERSCGGEAIGSDSSAKRCKALWWLTNLPGLGLLLFSMPSWS